MLKPMSISQGGLGNGPPTQLETIRHEKEHSTRLLEKRALAILEVQRGKVICSESHSILVGGPGFEPKSVGMKSL